MDDAYSAVFERGKEIPIGTLRTSCAGELLRQLEVAFTEHGVYTRPVGESEYRANNEKI